jgi:hypothetical protein
MKRHGDNPNFPAEPIRQRVFVSQSWKWLTERFGRLPQARLVFGEELPQLPGPNEKFKEL